MLKLLQNKKDLNDVTAALFSWQLRKRHRKRGSCDVIKVTTLAFFRAYLVSILKASTGALHIFTRCSTVIKTTKFRVSLSEHYHLELRVDYKDLFVCFSLKPMNSQKISVQLFVPKMKKITSYTL